MPVHSVAIGKFHNQRTRKLQKYGLKSSKLRQLTQTTFAEDKYTGYIITPSPICMMSSGVAMEILCVTNIGSILEKDSRC